MLVRRGVEYGHFRVLEADNNDQGAGDGEDKGGETARHDFVCMDHSFS